MANVNRHVKWSKHIVRARVRASTVIDKGDLLFLDRTAGLRDGGDSPATNSVFAFADIDGTTQTIASNQSLAYNNFIGVACYESISGNTENLAIATNGVFEFPLKSAKATEVGQVVMPTGSGASKLYSQKVEIWQSGTTYDIGMITRPRTRTINAEFRVKSRVFRVN